MAEHHVVSILETIVGKPLFPCGNRHSRESGNPASHIGVCHVDSRFRGNDDKSMSVSSRDLREYPLPVPESAGIPRAVQEQVLVAPFNDIETTYAIIEKHRDELGGVVVEPLQRWLPPKPGFLQGLREVTSRYEIPLVFDEVVSGFRLAWGGAQEYYDVVPDLAAYGKIMGGGFPLAAICGREEIMRLYDFAIEGTPDFVPQVGTLSGNPIAAVAGLATLRELKKPGAFEKLHAHGQPAQRCSGEPSEAGRCCGPGGGRATRVRGTVLT